MKPLLLYDDEQVVLARRLGRLAGYALRRIEHKRFPDGESLIRVRAPLNKRRVVILSALDRPDPKLFPALLAAAACRDGGARHVTWLVPYLPYMRQDKAFRSGEAVAARVWARVTSQHMDRVVTVDPHLHRIHDLQTIFQVPVHVVSAMPAVARFIHRRLKAPVVIGPDVESKQWVSQVAAMENLDVHVLKKHRVSGTRVRVRWEVPAELKRRTFVLIDDIIASGGTMAEVIRQLKRSGCRKIVCIGVHPVFAAGAEQKIRRAGASAIVSCNTLPHSTNRIDMASLLAPTLRQLGSSS